MKISNMLLVIFSFCLPQLPLNNYPTSKKKSKKNKKVFYVQIKNLISVAYYNQNLHFLYQLRHHNHQRQIFKNESTMEMNIKKKKHDWR